MTYSIKSLITFILLIFVLLLSGCSKDETSLTKPLLQDYVESVLLENNSEAFVCAEYPDLFNDAIDNTCPTVYTKLQAIKSLTLTSSETIDIELIYTVDEDILTSEIKIFQDSNSYSVTVDFIIE